MRVRIGRRAAWVIGAIVLTALGIAAVSMFLRGQRLRWSHRAPGPTAQNVAPAVPSLPELAPTSGSVAKGMLVRGVVRASTGELAAGATVTLYRAITDWPEWRGERLDQATTLGDGVFQFRADAALGLFVRVEHRAYATTVVAVPAEGTLELRLPQAFELFGFVTNDAGAPVPNARVALESVPGDQRRVEVTTTEPNGRYTFRNLAAGPVRLVARHESWQPAAEPAIVVGDQVRADLTFDRPAMAPIRGRVVSATTQAPIAGATIELLPANQKLGLVDPVATRTADDGAFLLTGLARGTVRMVVRHPEHGAVLRTQQIGIAVTDLSVEMPIRTTVTGVLVTDTPPALHRGGEVLELCDVAGMLCRVVVGADGRFRCDQPLSPGPLRIRALGAPFAFQGTWSDRMSITLEEAPRNDLELAVVPPTRLRGRVVGADGAPLPGASLVRTRVSAKAIGSAARQFDITALGSQVGQLFGTDREEVVATSDAEGRFEVRAAKPGPLLVRVELMGHGSRLVLLQIGGNAAPQVHEDIVMVRGGRLQGRVLRGTRPLVGATVTIDGEEGQAVVVSDRDGAWRVEDLVPGTYSVRARVPTGSAEGVGVVALDGIARRVDLRLAVERSVRGVVAGSDGQPLPGALVMLRGGSGRSTATDSEGEFVLEVPERSVELLVSLLDRSRQRVVPVPFGTERITVQLDTPPTCAIVARIVGLPGRKPLRGGVLRLTQIDGDEEIDRRSRWLEFPEGELRWPLCPAGRTRIEVWCEGYAPFVVERDVAANESHALGEILLEPAGRLVGVVRDLDGNPIPNAVVLLGEEGDLQLFEAENRSGADGSFRLSGVTSRSAVLVARAAGYAPVVVALQLPDDVLTTTPYELRLSRGATIQVVVPRQLARDGGYVQLLRDGRVLASSEIEESGRADFVNRAVGRYKVRLLGSDAAPKQVIVDPTAELVRVQLP